MLQNDIQALLLFKKLAQNQNIQMKSNFPIPLLSDQYFRTIHPPQLHKNHQADTIQQLRLQNELLKQQLSALIINNDQKQNKIHFQNKYIKNSTLNNEQEVQQRFKNKMLKLKSGRSRSKNNNHNETTPSSPKKQEEYRQDINVRQRVPFIPIRFRNQQNLKVMIVHRNNKGKFYRDQESEQKIKTLRMNSPQIYPPYLHQNSSKLLRAQNFPPQLSKNVLQLKGHQRSDTVPFEQRNGTLTKRINSRSITGENNKNICEFSRQMIENRKLSIEEHSKPCFKKMSFKNQIKQNLNVECAESREIFKPSVLSPRGAAYIDKIESTTTHNAIKSIQQDEQHKDSLLLIQKGIGGTKRKRKLRYDIYLEDEKNN